MGLSTNSVFHFTKSLEALQSILTSNFLIKYCLETIEAQDRSIQFAVPMASFCDIPLSQVSSHIDKYGGYGLGLKKTWAKRKGLNPVLYLEKNSSILNKVLIPEKFAQEEYRVVQGFLRFIKNYDGELRRGGELINKEYRYYDEREWRFCPNLEELFNQSKPIIHDVAYFQNNKAELNSRLHDTRLSFTLRDISYIIVKENDDILNLIDELNDSFFNEKDRQYLPILTSKIITSKQIRTDF